MWVCIHVLFRALKICRDSIGDMAAPTLNNELVSAVMQVNKQAETGMEITSHDPLTQMVETITDPLLHPS